jgi:16S rRNA (guanine527-N7)-methyltransferase
VRWRGEGPDALAGIIDVSRETSEKLAVFASLIAQWNSAQSLVASGEIPALWGRHIADSAQLVALNAGPRWIDLGTGAGLPGIVIALVGPPGTKVDLVESNVRKCAFLRRAVRETAAPAEVHQGRVENVLSGWGAAVDTVTSRAVAPLPRLLELAAPVLERGAVGLFPKGRGFAAEIAEATLAWRFDLVQHPSRIDPGGVILEVRNLRRER